MNFYPNERTLLFIDGPDLYAISRSIGMDIDFRRLKAFFQERCHLVRAFYYTTLFNRIRSQRTGRWSTGSTTMVLRW